MAKEEIRSYFTSAISNMYCDEVPLYKKLRDLVTRINQKERGKNAHLLSQNDWVNLGTERHGAIRLGTAQELSTMRRLFAVMGMHPVDYYDLSVAGIPVHSTAFRSVELKSLENSPFRVFTSLLRLDLIDDKSLQQQAETILARREIFSKKLLQLIKQSEVQNGLSQNEAVQFVKEALNVFRWHDMAMIDKQTYEILNQTHRLIADVVSFKGPHINHLTPTTLNIDDVQEALNTEGFEAKAHVEGPPKRKCPLLLRQTSFIALNESVIFADGQSGTHTARFGEIEQRGIALTPKGRDLYDHLLQQAKKNDRKNGGDQDYQASLNEAFKVFPDSHQKMRKEALAYFAYSVGHKVLNSNNDMTLDQLVNDGYLMAKPIRYEDFLPVSAAGIFQSNLNQKNNTGMAHSPNQKRFEEDLGSKVINSFNLYEKMQNTSLNKALAKMGIKLK